RWRNVTNSLIFFVTFIFRQKIMSETRLDKLRMFYNTPSFLGVNHSSISYTENYPLIPNDNQVLISLLKRLCLDYFPKILQLEWLLVFPLSRNCKQISGVSIYHQRPCPSVL